MVLVVLAGCFEASETRKKPNILLVMVDDLGPEWISAYGAEDVETPEIDQLAKSGLVFQNAWSMPQCTPTRISLLTGQYPFRHGWTNHWDVPRWGAGAHFDPDSNLTFVRLLRENGYATAAAGKWQVNDFRVQPDALQRHGFDEHAMWTGYETGVPASAERYDDPYINTLDGSRIYEGEFGPDVFTDFLIDFVERHKDDPWFAYFPMVLTHTPMVATPAEPNAQTTMERQQAMVRYVDLLVGRLVGKLDELGLRDNTIIIFTTDNGSTRRIDGRMSGRVISGGKGTLGENGVRQPFIVSAPNRVAVGESRALLDFSDLFPTILELTGTPIPTDIVLDGVSQASVLKTGSSTGPREWILSMGFGPARLTNEGVKPVQAFTDRVIRWGDFKLWVLDAAPSALYNLVQDPFEESNLLDAPSLSPEAQAALDKMVELLATQPATDPGPRYRPLPPQPWDRKPGDRL